MTLTESFERLLDRRGKAVTFRNLSIKVLPNDQGNTSEYGAIKASSELGSIVRFSRSLAEPETNEVFTDSVNNYRIKQTARDLGYCWECECEVSR